MLSDTPQRLRFGEFFADIVRFIIYLLTYIVKPYCQYCYI